ncbi:hypothetical protein ScalyP_jg4249 [Parmales sp. scaly parma]|nr:hypothetical protein ScalyP_jg4249 [Parmales sp. scaly parma]
MGLFKRILGAFGFLKHEVRILVIGLDNSGKTTLINHLKPRKAATFEVTPTVGFSVEEFSKHNLNFTCFDMSGESRYRNLWEQYYSDVQAVIFILDATDKLRICVARDELDELLNHETIKNRTIPILFYANKMDMAGAMTPVECMQTMSLDRITNKAWHITNSNALTGSGVDEGVAWVSDC